MKRPYEMSGAYHARHLPTAVHFGSFDVQHRGATPAAISSFAVRRQCLYRVALCLRHRERVQLQPSRTFHIMALTDQLPTITAYANDVGYDVVFVEQLKNFAEPGDLFMAISGSGNSPNVVRAIEYANSIGCRTIALTGRDGRQLGPKAQLNIRVPVEHMGRIEDEAPFKHAV
jgi:DNA-binding MurR/RpiR family transcriptional regulator